MKTKAQLQTYILMEQKNSLMTKGTHTNTHTQTLKCRLKTYSSHV